MKLSYTTTYDPDAYTITSTSSAGLRCATPAITIVIEDSDDGETTLTLSQEMVARLGPTVAVANRPDGSRVQTYLTPAQAFAAAQRLISW